MKENKFFSYIKAKGFYIALAVCIVGASATAWTLANRTLDSIDKNNGRVVDQNVSTEDKQWPDSQPPASPQVPAGESQEDITKPSQGSSSSSASPSSAGKVTKPADTSTAQGLQPTQQTVSYQWPIAGGQVITPYSGGELVKNKTLNVWRSHDALDIGGGQDAPVLAVGDGVIAAISNDPLWGGMIQLEHPDGHVTVYSGVRVDPALKTGGKVKAGDTLGTLDQIPAEISLDPHIHLEMSKNGVSVDPTQLLQQ